ncbi:MAG TPA: phage tail sheath subtilisin-like domain-containing protein [Microbacterium sp.]|nr:phage tail sheath subtilisin-like domain-containing protein [Microbacterium sp.]
MPTYLSPGVYIQELDAATRPIEGVGTAVAAFVGFAPRGPKNSPTLVTNWTQYVDQFGDIETGSYLALAVYGYFLNGGGRCYIVRIGAERPESQGQGKQQPKQVTGSQTATIGNYVFTAKNASANAKAISVEVAPADGDAPPDDEFKLTVNIEGKPPEVWGNVSSKPDSGNYVVTKVGGESKVITVEAVLPDVQTKPKIGSVALAIPEPKNEPIVLEKAQVSAANYIGDAADRTGFSGLEEIEDVTMVSVPDLMAAYEQGAIDLETVKGVQLAIVAHCELMGDRMAILDPPPGLSVQEVAKWRTNDSGLDSKFAALYYPWIKVLDPVTGSTRMVPPSAHMAGIWARNDNERGVHKAPANEIVRGAIDVQTKITRIEQEALNPIGVNAVRGFPGRGIRVWGARTLSSDPAWRYINVRRLFNYLEKSILLATQFAVFEPNDQALWGKLSRTITAFLMGEWRGGALFGAVPEQAFFVKCDEETNPTDSIDAGRVVCAIGVAPVKPAEFVIFQLSQFSGGSGSVDE